MIDTSTRPALPTGPIVVFGGAGFVGTHLLARLIRDGASQVISIDARPPRVALDGVRYITRDVRDLSDLTIGQDVSVIFNLAAVHTTPGHAPWEYYDTNVRGATQIARFAERHRTSKICFTSSISVYGPSEDPLDETAAPAPVSDYGRSKLMAEQILTDWANVDPARQLVIARPAVVFGAGEGGNFTRLAGLLRRGVFVYPGRRDTIKSCIYVEDLVDWMLYAISLPDPLILFNAAFHDRYTLETIVETFRDVAFRSAKTMTAPAALLKFVAALLRPASSAGLGFHPERIEKLMRSTNILPGWADAQGLPTQGRLRASLEAWRDQTDGAFT
jgi:GlcNAc-P-P-Und epimerase